MSVGWIVVLEVGKWAPVMSVRRLSVCKSLAAAAAAFSKSAERLPRVKFEPSMTIVSLITSLAVEFITAK